MSEKKQTIRLYLDLMKKTLSFSLWPEPPSPAYQNSPLKRRLIGGMVQLLGNRRLLVMEEPDVTDSARTDGRIWPGYADTMVGMKRLENLQDCIETVLHDDIPGDFIETGVWRGGSCIFMRAVLKAYGVNDRRVFVADSFAGLPRPDSEKYEADAGDKHYTRSFLAVSQETVEGNFRKYDLLDDQVIFLKGWFKDTLADAPIDRLAVLRLDGDMYESTMDSLNNLYTKLSAGGFCVIDDYALENCKRAVLDFRKKHNITEEMISIDWTGMYWRKKVSV